MRRSRAGKHVFVEKPLALTDDELDAVVQALQDQEATCGEASTDATASASLRSSSSLGCEGGPLVLTYRVNAGRLPDTHWYKDRRQGGRLLGEVCHFIDLASWVVGLPGRRDRCTWLTEGEVLLQEDLVLSLRFADGSVATISYAEFGHAGTSKERLEVLGRGCSAVIDDFSQLSLDGKERQAHRTGQGARRQPGGVPALPTRRWRRRRRARDDRQHSSGLGRGRLAADRPGGQGRPASVAAAVQLTAVRSICA